MSKSASVILQEFGLDPESIYFVIHPGIVMSINDGDHHYVNGDTLKKLWNIDTKNNCIRMVEQTGRGVYSSYMWEDPTENKEVITVYGIKAIHLYTDPTGEYDLEKVLQVKLMESF